MYRCNVSMRVTDLWVEAKLNTCADFSDDVVWAVLELSIRADRDLDGFTCLCQSSSCSDSDEAEECV
jgi:hypothetical protein